MEIKPYKSGDCPEMAQLFYDTVHTVAAKDYDKAQLCAWATGQVDLAGWNTSFLAHHTLLAWENQVLVGFADMDSGGYLDRLYVHKDYQGQGIATALVGALHQSAIQSGVCKFTTHASVTARPFFERLGYEVVTPQTVERNGVSIKNFVMEKTISITI